MRYEKNQTLSPDVGFSCLCLVVRRTPQELQELKTKMKETEIQKPAVQELKVEETELQGGGQEVKVPEVEETEVQEQELEEAEVQDRKRQVQEERDPRKTEVAAAEERSKSNYFIYFDILGI